MNLNRVPKGSKLRMEDILSFKSKILFVLVVTLAPLQISSFPQDNSGKKGKN